MSREQDNKAIVGRWFEGFWGNPWNPEIIDELAGSLPAASGRKMRFTGTTVLRVENGKIAEEVGLDDGVTALPGGQGLCRCDRRFLSALYPLT